MERHFVLPKVASFLLVALMLASCAQAAPVTPTAPSPSEVSISEEQAAALADEKVSYDEYQAAFRRYVACDEKAGYTVQVTDEVNQVISGQIPEAAVTSGVDEKCYNREFKQIDMIWQVSRQDTSPQAAIFRDCLVAKGVTPEATYAGMVEQLQELGVDPGSCK